MYLNLILDDDNSNDKTAKELAEKVNKQKMIATGVVPVGSTLFKVTSDPEKVLNYELNYNYPNPFNPSTKISWQSPVDGWQTLKVYDILGKEVATLVNEYRPAGRYDIEFNASNFSSGVYIYQLKTGSFTGTKKMILMR